MRGFRCRFQKTASSSGKTFQISTVLRHKKEDLLSEDPLSLLFAPFRRKPAVRALESPPCKKLRWSLWRAIRPQQGQRKNVAQESSATASIRIKTSRTRFHPKNFDTSHTASPAENSTSVRIARRRNFRAIRVLSSGVRWWGGGLSGKYLSITALPFPRAIYDTCFRR